MIGIILLAAAYFLFRTKRYYPSLLIFFLFLTNGFQVVPVQFLTAGAPVDKGTDFALLLTLLVTVTHFRRIKQLMVHFKILRWCLAMLGFIILEVFYSLFVMDYALVNVIQVFRPYLFLLSFMLFVFVPKETLERLFHTLAIITVCQAVLYLLQIVTKQTILLSAFGNEEVNITLTSGYSRYYNIPSYLTPVLCYFLYVYRSRLNVIHYLIILILFSAVVGPLHRSYILAIIAALSIYIFISQSRSNRIFLFAVLGIGVYLISFIGVVSKRMDETLADLQTTMGTRLSLQTIDTYQNTSLFRAAHLIERLEYIVKQPERIIFGIGLISDNTPQAAKLPFQIGLISERTGQISKVDTGDLVWSFVVLNLGIFGSLLFAVFHIVFLVFFFKNIQLSFAKIGFLTVLTAVFTSMAGVEMLMVTFRVIIILLAIIVLKQQAAFASRKRAAISETEAPIMY